MPNHSPLFRRPACLLLSLGAVLLTGCLDQVPGLGPDPRTIVRENEAKAIGGACRHALRGIEDCYLLNPQAPKAMVFAGWREMDEYMRDNKLEGSPSVLAPSTPAARAPASEIETEYRALSPSQGR